MKKASRYYELRYIVECQQAIGGFEPIAAFNVDTIAHKYAQDCYVCNPGFRYRVMVRRDGVSFAESKVTL